ncbi:MAG TPA: non-reducing end alpha-L-arabinofuranosidase family hydrolase [Asticcacaulis sp.]|nr:non-reducing end alpha-L-arabinofuranosidase family hydrolase [Asticcacaulis sp.]
MPKKTVAAILSAAAFATLSPLAVDAQAKTHDAFQWTASAPLITAAQLGASGYYGVKDPSVVFADGEYHVFMTTAGEHGWGLAYTSFSDWSQASSSPITPLDHSGIGQGYRAAPEVFYFAPQRRWYLIYQGGDPMFSTSENIDDPTSWTAPKPFFAAIPDVVKQAPGGGWLDFWIICDSAKCYLFFTNDGGDFFRAETSLSDFPNGFHNTQRVLHGARRDDVFEASNTYKIKGAQAYITLVEAIGPKGRYFRIWKSDRLDGEWTPVGGEMNVFASADNVQFTGAVWSEGVSHGEMVRSGMDQTLTIDPCQPLQFLFQGLDPKGKTSDYIRLPYRLGLLTAAKANPISRMCGRR